MSLNKGISLIESLIATVIIFFVAIGIMNMITMFGFSTQKRYAMECVINAVSSQVEKCKSRQNPDSTVSCGNYTVRITTNGSCQPSQGCNEVSITGQIDRLNIQPFTLRTVVCNFQ
ncbi:hypothetical protein [Sulfurihydrogenibium sp.]|uniref:type IV pilus modification PilV family protein n=1 Tax=Sulfurihydrogenibium sp. TaxID=2053621 RepID=UPI0026273C31|nr:hypothetical protein [Sulfurihydrogenibium sp.]